MQQDTQIFGEMIKPKGLDLPKVNIRTVLTCKRKPLEVWVRYHQMKNKLRIRLASEL